MVVRLHQMVEVRLPPPAEGMRLPPLVDWNSIQNDLLERDGASLYF